MAISKLFCWNSEVAVSSTSGPVAPLPHGISAVKYEIGIIIKAKFACNSLNEISGCWHSYFYTNACWPNHTHNHKQGR